MWQFYFPNKRRFGYASASHLVVNSCPAMRMFANALKSAQHLTPDSTDVSVRTVSTEKQLDSSLKHFAHSALSKGSRPTALHTRWCYLFILAVVARSARVVEAHAHARWRSPAGLERVSGNRSMCNEVRSARLAFGSERQQPGPLKVRLVGTANGTRLTAPDSLSDAEGCVACEKLRSKRT